MGRFDALNQLDAEKRETKPKTPASHSPTTKKIDTPRIVEEMKQPANDLKESAFFEEARQRKQDAENHDFMKTGNRESTPKTDIVIDKPQKYSTLLHTPIIRKIKVHSIENDMKDYEVIELALTQYFERHK